MRKTSGATNTQGFSSCLQNGKLPAHNHLTYEGLFNELRFRAGPKTTKTLDLSFGQSRFQFLDSITDKSVNDYLAIFMKSKNDGEDRSQKTSLNVSICLDISGSMSGGLGTSSSHNQKHETRLSLSLQAFRMLISKLKPNDSISLVTFSDEATVIFQQTLKPELGSEIFDRLNNIEATGGTTIINGFKKSKELLRRWLSKQNESLRENRIIILTDVGDSSISAYKKFIEETAEVDRINTTIIGISREFQSEHCEKFKDIRGFNYFCAVKQQDIKKYVFQTFDFGFFPTAYNIDITITSQNIQGIQVFGTPDSHKLELENKEKTTQFTITRMKSCFPSQIEINGDQISTVGGLILIKLKRKQKTNEFKANICLNYDDTENNIFKQNYQLYYAFHPEEQFFSGQGLRQVMEGFFFVGQLKSILVQSQKIPQKQEIYQRYWQSICKLQQLCPKSKLKDFQNVRKILKRYQKNEELQLAK